MRLAKASDNTVYGVHESHTWRYTDIGRQHVRYWRRFDTGEYSNSFLWGSNFVFRMTFLTLNVWGELSQKRLLTALGGTRHISIVPSLASNLEAGRRAGFYQKKGDKKDATFRVTDSFRDSKLFLQVRFVPTEAARLAVKKRANDIAQRRLNKC